MESCAGVQGIVPTGVCFKSVLVPIGFKFHGINLIVSMKPSDSYTVVTHLHKNVLSANYFPIVE